MYSDIGVFADDAALLADLNSKLSSSNMDVIEYLGGIDKDNSTGLITKATAIKVTFINEVSDEYPKEKHEEWEAAYAKFLNHVRCALCINYYNLIYYLLFKYLLILDLQSCSLC